MIGTVRVQRLDDLHRLVGVDLVAARRREGRGVRSRRSAVERVRSVWLGTDPAVPAEGIEQVLFEVQPLALGIRNAGRRIEAEEAGLRPRLERCVVRREVSLALVDGAVPARAEVVADRRHGVLREPEHVGIEIALCRADSLGVSVQTGILARIDRRARRHARRSGAVILREVHAVRRECVLRTQIAPSEGSHLRGLVHRREPVLIAREKEKVRPFLPAAVSTLAADTSGRGRVPAEQCRSDGRGGGRGSPRLQHAAPRDLLRHLDPPTSENSCSSAA